MKSPATVLVGKERDKELAGPEAALATVCTEVTIMAAAVLVSAKFAELAPVALATTLYGPPAVALAVNVVAVATPEALVLVV